MEDMTGEGHDWGKPSHYYTSQKACLFVYSSGWACPSHAYRPYHAHLPCSLSHHDMLVNTSRLTASITLSICCSVSSGYIGRETMRSQDASVMGSMPRVYP